MQAPSAWEPFPYSGFLVARRDGMTPDFCSYKLATSARVRFRSSGRRSWLRSRAEQAGPAGDRDGAGEPGSSSGRPWRRRDRADQAASTPVATNPFACANRLQIRSRLQIGGLVPSSALARADRWACATEHARKRRSAGLRARVCL
jgi:hypothetical protein